MLKFATNLVNAIVFAFVCALVVVYNLLATIGVSIIYVFVILAALVCSLWSSETYNAELTAYDAGSRSCGWHIAKEKCSYLNFHGDIVKCTVYHKNVGKPVFNNTDRVKIVGQTASGKIVEEGVTLAMPKQFPFGTEVYLVDSEGNFSFLGICQDRGSSKYIKVKEDGTLVIDVYVPRREDAIKFGRKYVKVCVVRRKER